MYGTVWSKYCFLLYLVLSLATQMTSEYWAFTRVLAFSRTSLALDHIQLPRAQHSSAFIFLFKFSAWDVLSESLKLCVSASLRSSPVPESLIDAPNVVVDSYIIIRGTHVWEFTSKRISMFHVQFLIYTIGSGYEALPSRRVFSLPSLHPE